VIVVSSDVPSEVGNDGNDAAPASATSGALLF
jgi:hypothetical protein